MHASHSDDVLDTREGLFCDFGYAARGWRGDLLCFAGNDDAPNHPGMLVRNAEIVVHAGRGKDDGEGLVRQKVVGVPGPCTGGNTQWMCLVVRVIGGSRVRIAGIHVRPPHCLAGLNEQADRLEPDQRAVFVTAHRNIDCFRAPGRRDPEGQSGEDTPADPQYVTPGERHCATRASSAAGTCHSTTWACGFSTPGWPALK